MKQILSIVLLTVGLFSLLAKGGPSRNDDTQQLISLEQELSAAVAKQDAVVLDRLWSNSLVFTFPDGTVSNKARRLASQKPSGQPSQSDSEMSNHNDEIKLYLYGDTAVVTVRSTWSGKENNRAYSSQFQATHVWARQGGRWQLVAAHVSAVKK